MMVSRRVSAALAAAALFVTLPAAVGCDAAPEPKVAQITAGDLPQGAKWDGVYYNELYGYLHLVASGNQMKGKWLRRQKDKWGELKGEITGDLLKFTWTEHTVGAVGPNSSRSGRGYFKYKRPEGENVDDTLKGEIGKGIDETGEPWDAIKQRNLPPDLDSIGGSGAADLGGGDWDNDNKEKGKPEGPAKPKR